MKIEWEVLRKEDIKRMQEIYSNPTENGSYIIQEYSFGWIKKKVSKIIETGTPKIELLSGKFNTLEECQAYITKIEE